jgi:glycosyltransferase involved in cell wall biosynthesis
MLVGASMIDAMKFGATRIGALIVTSTATAASAVLSARSIAFHHPEIDPSNIDVVVVDDRFGEVVRACSAEPGTWHRAIDVLNPDLVLLTLARHELRDVVTALTPLLLRLAVGRHPGGVCLVADHVVLTKPLAWFAPRQQSAESQSGPGAVRVITVRPPNGGSIGPSDGRFPDIADLYAYGRFQRGLVMFGPGTIGVVKRWIRDTTDQPLDDTSRFNRLAHPWLTETGSTAGLIVDDAAMLGSFRNLDAVSGAQNVGALSFEGFDPSRPWLLSEMGGEWPRVLVSNDPVLTEAIRVRCDALKNLSVRWQMSPYDALANGHPYDAAMRTAFETAHRDAVRHGVVPPPNPFAESDEFVTFLSSPSQQRPGISRHLASWAAVRPDLAATFATDDNAFWRWAATDALDSGLWISPRPFDEPPDMQREVTSETAGINVIGLISAQLGIGEQARLAIDAIRDAGIPYSIIDHPDTIHERDLELVDDSLSNGFVHDIDVLLLNAEQTSSALRAYNRGGKLDRLTIGLWAWETPVFPERFHQAYNDVSEVWVLSDFIAETLLESASAAQVEVHVLPVQLPYVTGDGLSGDRMPTGHFADHLRPFGIDPKRPYCLFMFDYFSVAERKQPWRVIEAFRVAFPHPSPSSPQLIIKSMNHEFFPTERERVLFAAAGRDDIVMVEKYLPSDQRHALVAAAGAYISLHRSEGFGLTLAEAMGAGTPVIATGWSGNLNFMTEENSWLVGYDLVDIPRTVRHYGGLGQWAEPSVDHAAKLIRNVFDNPAAAQLKAQQAIADLVERNASGADANFVIQRIRALRSAASQTNNTSNNTGSTTTKGHYR